MTKGFTTETRRHRGNITHVSFLCVLCASVVLISHEALSKERCRPNSPYYFSEFNPAAWKVENELNYEEVYKNFEYFEVSFNSSCDEITVKRYKKGQLDSSEKFELNNDGTIQKKGDKE